MAQRIDQIFVTLLGWVTGLLPEALRGPAALVIGLGAILAVFGLLFGLTTVCERKAIARMQNRLGPNRVGPFGFLQFVADGIKSLTKEDVVPRTADPVVHFLAPLALLVPVVLTFLVLPFGRNLVALDLDVGLLFFFAAGASTELAVFMAGWSSRNKYSLLGAMRWCAGGGRATAPARGPPPLPPRRPRSRTARTSARSPDRGGARTARTRRSSDSRR